MEAIVFKSGGGDPFQYRHVDWSAKGAGGAKADVVDQDYDHVRGALWCFHLEAVGCLCIAGVQFLVGLSGWFLDRQNSAIQFTGWTGRGFLRLLTTAAHESHCRGEHQRCDRGAVSCQHSCLLARNLISNFRCHGVCLVLITTRHSPLATPTPHRNLNVIEKSKVLPWVSSFVPTSQMYRKLNIANWLKSFLSGSTSAISGPSP